MIPCTSAPFFDLSFGMLLLPACNMTATVLRIHSWDEKQKIKEDTQTLYS